MRLQAFGVPEAGAPGALRLVRWGAVVAAVAGFGLLAAGSTEATRPKAGAARGAAEGPRVHVVEMRAFAFAPETLTVAAGDTVAWVNRDPVPHTATDVAREWDSGSLAAGAEWRVVVAASADVVCRFHPTMRGRIVVR